MARQATQFAFGDVQPTAMLRCVTEVDPLNVGPRLLGRKCRVERSLGVRVEVIADQGDLCTVGVTRVQQVGHLDRPVDLGALLAGGRLAKAAQRFREQENARGALALVFVIDTLDRKSVV